MINRGLLTSNTDQWATPQKLFDELNKEFSFDLDVCAEDWNSKCKDFFSPEQDGLAQSWGGSCWMNPPYGRQIGKWMQKALEESEKGSTVVCLVPARTDTAWWHDYATKGEIRFIRGRIKFESRSGGGQSAPFPSAIVIFRKKG